MGLQRAAQRRRRRRRRVRIRRIRRRARICRCRWRLGGQEGEGASASPSSGARRSSESNPSSSPLLLAARKISYPLPVFSPLAFPRSPLSEFSAPLFRLPFSLLSLSPIERALRERLRSRGVDWLPESASPSRRPPAPSQQQAQAQALPQGPRGAQRHHGRGPAAAAAVAGAGSGGDGGEGHHHGQQLLLQQAASTPTRLQAQAHQQAWGFASKRPAPQLTAAEAAQARA